MPVFLEADTHDRRSGRFLKIGLINNMADEALGATERQYVSLLESASEDRLIHLSFYTLPGIPRKEPGTDSAGVRYSSICDLWHGQIDGLIVTGREPLATSLTNEPYWGSFAQLVEWAQENTYSAIWSCLAAHAAILYLDGIDRTKRNEKLFGIFNFTKVSEHPLTAGTGLRFGLPHSRWNDVAREDLEDCGYRLLSRAAGAGVDTFIKEPDGKELRSLLIFFQGHPEYEPDTLLREYRRDVSRYFKGETALYPSMPWNYFDEDTVKRLKALQDRASEGRTPECQVDILNALAKTSIEGSWHTGASTIYRNWLKHVWTQKEKASKGARGRQRRGPVEARSGCVKLDSEIDKRGDLIHPALTQVQS
jgi:homoserine O-succinyltransferase